MARQTSKNRWVNGKNTLKWFSNNSEFAGGSEMGHKVPLGHFVVEDEKGEVIDQTSAYQKGEFDQLVDLFMKAGTVTVPQDYKSSDVLEIVLEALRSANDNRINDVTVDYGVDRQRQIIITTDNGVWKQLWVLDAESILQTDPPYDQETGRYML